MSQQEMRDIVVVEKPDLQFTDLKGNNVRLISMEDESYLEAKSKEILEFMRNNHNQDISDEEKDKLYLDLQSMWNEVSGRDGGKLNTIGFQLILHRQEYNYLVSLFKNKMEYDVDSIFAAIELDTMLKRMTMDDKFEDDQTAKSFDMTTVDIHYLYQLLSKHTVRGLTKESYYFAEVIKRIALASKVFNYYKETFANIAKAVQLWVASLDKGVVIHENDPIYQLIWGDSDTKPSFHVGEEVEELREVEESSAE